MYKRIVGIIILTNILISLLVPTLFSEPLPDEPPWWNDEYNYRKELIIPIDTSKKQAKYQPIDILLEFEEYCWAKNENEHSVRVCSWNGNIWKELESQIYDLTQGDNEHIISCSLIFLIPEESDGNEKYYVYYDEDEKLGPDYPNRVDVEEDYYRYEQIPGLIFESYYFKILEGDYIVYAINKEGEALGSSISQQIAKLKKETEVVKPNRGVMGVSLNFRYWWFTNKDDWKEIATYEKFMEKQIFIDGNLMVKFGIKSQSEDGLLQSTVIYKYYYCPTEEKRIYLHVKHEIINYPLPAGEEVDSAYANFDFGNIKSSNIDELNFGRIYPFMHFYSKEERIIEKKIPQYPEGIINVISKQEDNDLGSSPWVSVDDGENGEAHALIFETTDVIKSGDVEREGITLELFETDHYKLPGLNSRLATLLFLKNSYESGEKPDDELPNDFVVEYNAEFFSTENGGYPAVAEEAKLYQSLIKYQPTQDDNITDDEKETDEFNLTAYVHLAPSFPFGSFLYALGKNVSYLSAEVYKENSTTSSRGGIVSRLSLVKDIPTNFNDLSLLEKLKFIDWKNFSFFKKIHFPNLEKGRYLIKIFRENPFLKKEKQFIGFTIVDLDKDKETRIFCKQEGKVSLNFLNQNQEGIKNVQTYLKKDDFIIAYGESDSIGKTTIRAPCGILEKYMLKIIYKGFLVNEEQIRLGRIRKILPLRKTFSLDLHDFEIKIRDSEDKVPTFNVDFSLTSKEMHYPTIIKADNVSQGIYKFNDLYPANYILTIKYNTFEIIKEIKIPDIDSLEIKLYDFSVYIKDLWNLSPEPQLDVVLKSNDFEKPVVLSGEKQSLEKYYFNNLYPGKYILKVSYKTFSLEESIEIPEMKITDIVFPALYNLTTIIFDSHGNYLKDAEILIIRNDYKLKGSTNESGTAVLSIPPGSYLLKVLYNNDLIATRKVEVFSNTVYRIVTTNEPLIPYIVILLSVIVFIGFAATCYRKKDLMFFLKIIAILLVLVAIFSPWWELNGSASDSNFETSTKLYISPIKMVTIISNSNVTSGEIANLKNDFVGFVDNYLPIAIAIGFILIISSIILNMFSFRKLSIIILFLGLIFYICFISIYVYELPNLTDTIVGSIFGSGNLEINIPGENIYEIFNCSWGLGAGFYLLLCSIIIQTIAFYLNLKKIKNLK
ncbi:hypothetical protein AYK24_07170 [Thermoplasmatales archaeon SG8-52-4]|nr:MAG: hypothetical protein AYK24_07170 [Thermoplasmatales archaeon SG8-52-4]